MANTKLGGTGVSHIKTKDIRYEDGEWWYVGQADGRRRVKAHENKNNTRMFVNGKYIPKSHTLHKAGRFKTFEGEAFSSLKGYESTTEGYVYVISNPSFDGWLKVGMAVDAEDRCNQYQTGSPHRDYRLLYSRRFKDRREAETLTMRKLKKVVKEHNGEWFKTDRDTVQKIIEDLPITI